ncbi:unnamed protein product [Phytophthora fragariaefolia]|uniref:Unnamed protein product n=1 Tax=Phytophthora fragariaefolia TaxID=1490495 RepID=A0A9W6Y560_9STRA|nr:unnamed protein product [Phytophthora fragariaefolia]
MTNGLGYCKGVVEKKKKWSKTISRGTYKRARSKLVPNMTAISWWDTRPVHFLCTGGSLETDRVTRHDGPNQVDIPCPRVIKDYHAFMGGVDVHDQLRLQRYSIQRALRFRKYYKSLVLGLIDMAIVNGYIMHKAYYKNKTTRPLSHVKYMKKLHMQLCALQAVDMYESNTFGTREPIPAPRGVVPTVKDTSAHTMRQIQCWCNADTQPKRRRGACKACPMLHAEGKRAATSKYFCLERNKEGPLFLCRSARYPVRGVAMICWDIWHREWSNGQLMPVDNGRSIRIRPATAHNEDAPSTPGIPATPASRNKRRRTGTPV